MDLLLKLVIVIVGLIVAWFIVYFTLGATTKIFRCARKILKAYRLFFVRLTIAIYGVWLGCMLFYFFGIYYRTTVNLPEGLSDGEKSLVRRLEKLLNTLPTHEVYLTWFEGEQIELAALSYKNIKVFTADFESGSLKQSAEFYFDWELLPYNEYHHRKFKPGNFCGYSGQYIFTPLSKAYAMEPFKPINFETLGPLSFYENFVGATLVKIYDLRKQRIIDLESIFSIPEYFSVPIVSSSLASKCVLTLPFSFGSEIRIKRLDLTTEATVETSFADESLINPSVVAFDTIGEITYIIIRSDDPVEGHRVQHYFVYRFDSDLGASTKLNHRGTKIFALNKGKALLQDTDHGGYNSEMLLEDDYFSGLWVIDFLKGTKQKVIFHFENRLLLDRYISVKLALNDDLVLFTAPLPFQDFSCFERLVSENLPDILTIGHNWRDPRNTCITYFVGSLSHGVAKRLDFEIFYPEELSFILPCPRLNFFLLGVRNPILRPSLRIQLTKNPMDSYSQNLSSD